MKDPQLPDIDKLNEEIKHMFASAWQDGVHHLNPKYLRRDTLFTEETIKLFKSEIIRMLEALKKEAVLYALNRTITDELRGREGGKVVAIHIEHIDDLIRRLSNGRTET